MRHSGIDVIGEVHWGWHLCQFYRTREDLVDILVPYFMAGLKNNELCVWVAADPLPVEEAKAVLRAAMPDMDRYIQSGQLEIFDYAQWYLRSGSFDSNAGARACMEKEAQALRNGFAGLRANGNVSWLQKEKWKEFWEYELQLNENISSRKILTICSYPLTACGTVEIIDVVATHQFALIKEGATWRVVASSECKKGQESGQRLAAIIDFLPDATFVIDTEGIVVAWNKAIEQITGVKAKDIIGKGGYEPGRVFYGEPRPVLIDLVFKSEAEIEQKYSFLKREDDTLIGENFVPSCWGGKGAYLWGTARLLRDTNGTITGAIESIRDISDWKKAETELNFKARIIDSAIDSIFVYDMDGKIIFVNQAAATSRRYTREELIGADMRQLGIHEFSPYPQEHKNELMEKGKVIFETVHFRKDGSQIPVEVHAQLIDLREQKVIMAVARDITDRILAEAARRESEQRFKAIFDTASDGIVVADAENKKILLANKAVSLMLGYRGDELVNMTVPDLHRNEDLEEVMRKFNLFFRGEISQSIDLPFLRKDGSLQYVDMSAAGINIGERKCMVAVLRDAGPRKLAEEALFRSNERFRTLVSNILGAAYRCRCDASRTTEFISEEIERISGYPAADFIENKVRSYLSIIYPEDRQLVEGSILEAVNKKQPYMLEYRIVHSNGETRWVYERGQGVLDVQGRVVCFDGAIFDFTERKQMELSLREKIRDLEIFHKVAVGRELRLEELKKRIKDLESQLQQPTTP